MSTRTFNEQPIKTVVGEILAEHGNESNKDDIMREIIKLQKGTNAMAQAFFNSMVILGLDNCKCSLYRYDIAEFARMRHYFTHDEIKHLTSTENRVRKSRRN